MMKIYVENDFSMNDRNRFIRVAEKKTSLSC